MITTNEINRVQMTMSIEVSPSQAGEQFEEFVRIIKLLRDPVKGCPWDLEQTHESIRRYLIEETYEVLEALDVGDDEETAIEFGDLLLQVVLHSQIAADRGAFDIVKVLRHISEKMIRRHPHIFANETVSGADDVLSNWEKIKLSEKKKVNPDESKVLGGVPRSLPALIRAQRLGEKASQVKFDWNNAAEVLEKIREELDEVSAELRNNPQNKQRIEEELGDLLFAASCFAGHCEISAEDALARAGDRFQKRFAALEKKAGDALSHLSSEEMDQLWREVKLEESK